MVLKMLTIALMLMTLTASSSYADHEHFIVAEMRNVDPSADIITSTSGACIPSHDRERLECYFTSFGLGKIQSEEQMKRQYDELVQELDKAPEKQMQKLKTSVCSNKNLVQPDPIRLKYNVSTKTFFVSMKAFCEHPITRDSALTVLRALAEADAKKCRCIVTEWRSTFVRQIDRWVKTLGRPGGVESLKSSR